MSSYRWGFQVLLLSKIMVLLLEYCMKSIAQRLLHLKNDPISGLFVCFCCFFFLFFIGLCKETFFFYSLAI